MKATNRITIPRSVLLVIDMQETIFRRCLERQDVEKNAVKLIKAANALGLPILVTEQYPEGLGGTSEGIAAALGEFQPIPKRSFSSLGEPEFEDRLRATGRDTVIICGIEAHICVYQTGRDLTTSGKQVHVAGDAITSRGKFDLEVAVDRMRREGVTLSSTELIIYELLGSSGTDEFKRLLPLLKE
ncbi:MAG: hydrolase [Planctomycetota bacterium]|nr:hydrolase [Planctomycetota bacterium]